MYAHYTRDQQTMKSYLERKSSAISGKHFEVEFIDDGESLGYTSGEDPRTIYLAWEHPYYKGLSEKEKKLMITGVFAHELLHQLYTDFNYMRTKLSKLSSQSLKSVMMKFANILEDPAIEHRAPEAYGGNMLNALRYTIKKIYDLSPEINETEDPFLQYMNALINFGDVGFVKGEFTYEESYETFVKTAPLFNKGVEERSGKRRIDIAEKIMDQARPLWEKSLKQDEEIRQQLRDLLKQAMESMGETSDDANPDDTSEGESGGSDTESFPEAQRAAERRKKTLEKIAEAAKELGLDQNDESDGSGNDHSDKDNSSENTDTASVKDGTGSKDEPMSESESGKDSTSSDDTGDRSGYSDPESESDDKPDMHSFDLSDDEKNGLDEEPAAEYIRQMAEAMDELEDSLKKEERRALKEAEEADRKEDLMELDAKRPLSGQNVRCTNRKAGEALDIFRNEYSPEAYHEIIARNRGKINRLVKGLKEIFETEKEEKLKTTSGRYNVLRGASSTSARIFDRRRDPGNKADTAVAVAIDCSGSMACEGRSAAAKESACILGEALRICNIPHYMFGFTADISGADAYHVHYVTWDNWKSKKAHEKLSEISPGFNNFDSYSIDYAGELLKKTSQQNKVLIVISDGEPECNSYISSNQGIKCTTDSIEEVKKHASVCGIAIGSGVDGKILQGMYGANFIHIQSIDEFSNAVIKRFLKTIRNI